MPVKKNQMSELERHETQEKRAKAEANITKLVAEAAKRAEAWRRERKNTISRQRKQRRQLTTLQVPATP